MNIRKAILSIAAISVATVPTATAVAHAATADTAATTATSEAVTPLFEEHRFTGSSTSAAAFEQWFKGEPFVAPKHETRDLRELRVNAFEVAHAGDVIYKDDQGRFWIKKKAVIK